MFESPDPRLIEQMNLVYCAKYLGVSPWELAKQSIYWLSLAELCMEVEHDQGGRTSGSSRS